MLCPLRLHYLPTRLPLKPAASSAAWGGVLYMLHDGTPGSLSTDTGIIIIIKASDHHHHHHHQGL